MEPKTFTIIDSETQTQKTIQSNATTVAELKSDLRANGINPDGKTIREGISRTELSSDASILPHDVPYKGTTTNNLVFQLTRTNKKVRSGAMSRKEAYDYIKKHNLGDKVKAKFGKNFTCCKTDDLISMINSNQSTSISAEAPKVAPKVEKPQEVKVEPKEETKVVNQQETTSEPKEFNAEAFLKTLVDILETNGCIDEDDKEFLYSTVDSNITTKEEPKDSNPYTSSEVSDMFENW